jgi:DNA polymerase-3 subunit delta'
MMRTTLLIGSDSITIEKEVTEILKKHTISPFDVTTVQKEKAIGIEDIRIIQKNIFLSPLKGKQKAVVIHQADTMTPQAQNALLKTLEEPPIDTLIILLGKTKEAFLPTVLSRCFIKEIIQKEKAPGNSEDFSFLLNMSSISLAEKLRLAQTNGKTKEQALIWVNNAILSLRENLIKTPHPHIAFLLEKLAAAEKLLQSSNAQPRIVLEHCFLQM